jgi:hypothetical protein
MALLEEEGLLDDVTIGRFNPGLLQITAMFETDRNTGIAKLAMAQTHRMQLLRKWLNSF